MILNGHYIYVFPSGSHETELYFTLTSAQTLYFAFLGATIKIDDNTTLVTPTDYTMTSANYSNYPGVSHTFTAGNHKIFIDSTNPAIPYTSYNDWATRPAPEYGDYYDASLALEKAIVSSIYDTRQIGGRQQYQSTGKAMFYLKNNYFSNLIIVGRLPDFAFNKTALGYYAGANIQSTLSYGSWPATMVTDFTDCVILGCGTFGQYTGVSLLSGTAFDNLEEIKASSGVFGNGNLGTYSNGFTSYTFSKLKKVGNSAIYLSASSYTDYFKWEFPVLEELGNSCFTGKTVGGNYTSLIADANDSDSFHLPNIKTIGTNCFYNRASVYNTMSGRPFKVYLGNKIESIGQSAFQTRGYTTYKPASYGVQVFIDALTPPAIENYTFACYDSNYRQYNYYGNAIRVPSSKVNTYKNATNFSLYSNYISAQ